MAIGGTTGGRPASGRPASGRTEAGQPPSGHQQNRRPASGGAATGPAMIGPAVTGPAVTGPEVIDLVQIDRAVIDPVAGPTVPGRMAIDRGSRSRMDAGPTAMIAGADATNGATTVGAAQPVGTVPAGTATVGTAARRRNLAGARIQRVALRATAQELNGVDTRARPRAPISLPPSARTRSRLPRTSSTADLTISTARRPRGMLLRARRSAVTLAGPGMRTRPFRLRRERHRRCSPPRVRCQNGCRPAVSLPRRQVQTHSHPIRRAERISPAWGIDSSKRRPRLTGRRRRSPSPTRRCTRIRYPRRSRGRRPTRLDRAPSQTDSGKWSPAVRGPGSPLRSAPRPDPPCPAQQSSVPARPPSRDRLPGRHHLARRGQPELRSDQNLLGHRDQPHPDQPRHHARPAPKSR